MFLTHLRSTYPFLATYKWFWGGSSFSTHPIVYIVFYTSSIYFVVSLAAVLSRHATLTTSKTCHILNWGTKDYSLLFQPLDPSTWGSTSLPILNLLSSTNSSFFHISQQSLWEIFRPLQPHSSSHNWKINTSTNKNQVQSRKFNIAHLTRIVSTPVFRGVLMLKVKAQ